jgi:hypothetical protein
LKVLRFLSVPTMAVGMLTLLMATASANHATIKAQLNCTSSTQVCFNLTVSTADFPADGRDITATLLGHKKGDSSSDFVTVSGPQTVHLAQNLDNASIQLCFPNVTASNFDTFELDLKVVGTEFDINGQTEVKLGPFDNSCPTPTPIPSPSVSTSPSGGSGGGSPAPSASANTTAALAQTGGFDFRYPLIGLILLVAGGALFVVSASRGRSSTTK